MYNTLLIFLTVFITAFAQLMLKQGMMMVHIVNWKSDLFLSFVKIFSNLFVLGGAVLYMLGFVMWLIVLSKNDISYAYPFVSLGYVIVVIGGYLFFDESFSLYKILGVIFILIGLIILFKST